MYCTDAAYCYRCRMHIAWSVCLCLSVCWACGWALQNGWTDRDAIWRLTHVDPRNHVLDRGRDPPRKGAIFGGCPAQWIALGVSAAMYAAKGFTQSSITSRRAMRPFIKILWPLVPYDTVTATRRNNEAAVWRRFSSFHHLFCFWFSLPLMS